MLKLFYFFYLNRNHLELRFLYLAFYRKCYRIKYKLRYIDFEDKLFLSLLFCNSIIGFYSVLSVSNPSLRLAEIFILFPLICLYLYICNKKMIGTAYYHYIWLICMVVIFMLNASTFILDVLYYEGVLLQDENNQELSFISEYLVKFLSSLFETIETNNFSLCSPELPVEIQKDSTKTFKDHFTQAPYSKVKFSIWNAVTRGMGAGLFTQTMKKNPRLTYTVAGTTAMISFVSDLVDS